MKTPHNDHYQSNRKKVEQMSILKRQTLPSATEMQNPLLLALFKHNYHYKKTLTLKETYKLMEKHFNISEEVKNMRMKGDGRNHWKNRVQYGKRTLINAGYAYTVAYGEWALTKKGRRFFGILS